MSVKDKVANALCELVQNTTGLETWIPESAREESGTYEVWKPKDLLAHSAEWTERRVQILAESGEVPAGGGEELGDVNKILFDRHVDTPWEDILEMLNNGVSALLREVDRREEADLTAIDPSTGGKFPVWRGIAFYGIVHNLTHICQALLRTGNTDAAVALQHKMAPALLDIDDSGAWRGLVSFNVARVLCLAGQIDEARAELSKAIADNPDLSGAAEKDPDFEPIRDTLS